MNHGLMNRSRKEKTGWTDHGESRTAVNRAVDGSVLLTSRALRGG